MNSIREYQMAAIDAAVSHLEISDRAQVQMACGTGKTLVCHEVADRLVPADGDGTILVLFPNLTLISQTIRSWKINHGVQNIMAFCSDLPEDEAGEQIPHTTDPAELLAHMNVVSGRKVVFSTYQSSPNLVGHDLPVWDLIVFDEAHRAAGAADSAFATAVDNTLVPARKRFFATATPRITSVHDDEESVDMNNFERFGERVFTFSHKEAVDGGWINDFNLVLVAVTDDEIRASILEELEDGGDRPLYESAAAVALSKASKRFNLSTTLTYHNSIDNADRFAAALPGIDRRVNGAGESLLTFSVSSRDSQKAERVLDLVRSGGTDRRLVVSNCRLLGEGVDVAGLDSLCFVDPRSSVIDVTQAIGRIVRVDHSKGMGRGTVVLPVMADSLDAGVDASENAVDRSKFTAVYETLNALQALDSRMGDELLLSNVPKRPTQPEMIQDDAGHDSQEAGQCIEEVEKSLQLAERLTLIGDVDDRFISNVQVMLAERRGPRDPLRHRDAIFLHLASRGDITAEKALDKANWLYDSVQAARLAA